MDAAERRGDAAPPAVSALIVCTANICRSPAVAFMASRSGAVIAVSAGMRARPGSPMCPTATARISSYDGAAEYTDAFRSRSVQTLDIGEFELLLTATRSMRSELVKQRPLLRDRAFTVREAAALVRQPLSPLEASILLAHGPVPVMTARRGSRTYIPPRSIPGHRAADPIDLPDAHNDRRRRRHLATVELAADSGAELGATLQLWRDSASELARTTQ